METFDKESADRPSPFKDLLANKSQTQDESQVSFFSVFFNFLMRTVRTETQFTLEEKPSAPCCSWGLFEKIRVSYTLQPAEPPYSVNNGPIKNILKTLASG